MKIVFFTHTPLAGMPYRTCKVMDPYLREEGGWARCVVSSPNAYGTRTYPTDLVLNTPEAHKVIEDCDLIIVPAYISSAQFGGVKPVARHLSTEQFRWVDQEPSPDNHTVVAQYQARFAPGVAVLPNCISIDDPTFMPAEKPEELVIVYTPTSRSQKPGDWANKGYNETVTALRRIERDYRGQVRVFLLQNRPYEEVMAVRRRAHIVIDECATGSYHTTTLEGLSCGAATICRIDDLTQEALNRLLPGKQVRLPVLNTTLIELEERLRVLVENRATTEEIGASSRAWMQTNYSERWQAETWISWHRSFLQRSVRELTR